MRVFSLLFLSTFFLPVYATMPQKAWHMVYFPWDKQQHFLVDDQNFDHGPYESIMQKATQDGSIKVYLWTLQKTKKFCQKNYPEIWKTLETYATRPVMYVDIIRWLVVYHYGGVYMQYHCVPKKPLQSFYPKSGTVRFFTEQIISKKFAEEMANQPIRNGKKEERRRIMNQLFSTKKPKSKIVFQLIQFLLQRLRTHTIQCDYDVLYTTANAAVSEFYDRHCKNNPTVECTSHEEMLRMMKIVSMGSWRLNPKNFSQKP